MNKIRTIWGWKFWKNKNIEPHQILLFLLKKSVSRSWNTWDLLKWSHFFNDHIYLPICGKAKTFLLGFEYSLAICLVMNAVCFKAKSLSVKFFVVFLRKLSSSFNFEVTSTYFHRDCYPTSCLKTLSGGVKTLPFQSV